ncbi:MAG: hypothetical protein ACOY31_04025 [Bacillota bacterium]
MKRGKKIFIGAGLFIILAVAAAALLKGGTQVETVVAATGNITSKVTETGYVQPAADAGLYAARGGTVVQTPVQTGRAVKRGETLAVLEDLDLKARVTEVRSQFSQAEASAEGEAASLERSRLELGRAEENLGRVRELFSAGAAGKAEYDSAVTQVEILTRACEEQEALLKNARSRVAGAEAITG